MRVSGIIRHVLSRQINVLRLGRVNQRVGRALLKVGFFCLHASNVRRVDLSRPQESMGRREVGDKLFKVFNGDLSREA